MKLVSWALCVVLISKLYFSVEQVKEYRYHMGRMEAAVGTLKLDFEAERNLMFGWKVCAKQGWCRDLPIFRGMPPRYSEAWEFRC